MSGDIYFCLCGATNTVKIGHSLRVQKRVRFLDAICPFGVALQTTVAGSLFDEQELHRALGKYRTRPGRRTEWYYWNEETQALAEMARVGASASEIIARAYAVTGAERRVFRREFSCMECGNAFTRSSNEFRNGQSKYCSYKCAGMARRGQPRLAKQIEEALA